MNDYETPLALLMVCACLAWLLLFIVVAVQNSRDSDTSGQHYDEGDVREVEELAALTRIRERAHAIAHPQADHHVQDHRRHSTPDEPAEDRGHKGNLVDVIHAPHSTRRQGVTR